MNIKSINNWISNYNFLKLYLSIMVLEKKEVIIEQNKLQHDLVKAYDNKALSFLFIDISKKESKDDSYIDLNEAFLNAEALGLIGIFHDNKKIKHVVFINEKEAYNIMSRYKENEIYAMTDLINNIYSKKDNKTLTKKRAI